MKTHRVREIPSWYAATLREFAAPSVGEELEKRRHDPAARFREYSVTPEAFTYQSLCYDSRNLSAGKQRHSGVIAWPLTMEDV
jgi:hypothetical protein